MAAATTIVNARVFDGAAPRDWTSVRFAGGVITGCSATPAVMDGDEVIDAAGGTVLPGLIDTHVHLVAGALARSLTFGVTTVLDMFSEPGVVAAARGQAGSRPDVADVRSSGVGATAPGGHPSMLYDPFPTLTSAEQAPRFVDDRIAEGCDYLKVFSGPGGLWPSLDAGTVTALVAAAHTRGLVVVAHVSSTAGLRQVVSAGVDVVAHVPTDADLDDALVARVAEAGIAVGPTLATVENTLGGAGGAAVLGDPRLAGALGDVWVRRLTSDAPVPPGRHLPPYSRAEDNVRRLADAGVTLLAGTDAPNPGTVFGASLHRELELLVRCGLGPARALAAATTAPARVFGLTDRGRVAPGQRADLVLVSGDPLTDITATRGIERIWRAGIPCDRNAFVAGAAETAQLDAFDARIAAVVAAVRARRPGPRNDVS
ncbi:amidohydrolase family protein [Dactylosporangium aurantiacum]|uniref:Amidohydrolase family protein n=1 Tax=Dactylosporangium aurantiacum TaxID=35754 RepID=A0A9Q9ILS6_9ACTN|nr:amidohydrolase family protein [Dactylosporangium aurantiacum]MDG6105804.1 amidohydrolase family protein [Dactylosporangium aurantiacum]UWZ58011.1 amidohydrolase family protein [Dactylosporangium aurantiacum]